MRIVFLGTPQAAVPSLEALIEGGYQVVLAVTQPDRPAKRSVRPVEPPVKVAAIRHGIAVIQPAKVRTPDFLAKVEDQRPDILVTVAYGRILTKPVLDAAALGAVNVHFSLLPKYRGAAPVQWALARQESVTGVTTMRMNERLDEGDILIQEPVPIAIDEHAPELQVRLAQVGASVLLRTLEGLAAGSLISRPQDHALASFAPPLSRSDGEVSFTLEAGEIEGRVRGFDPWPGAWSTVRGRRVRLRHARYLKERESPEPSGTVLEFESGALRVACGNRTVLELFSLQPESGRELSAADARNGRLVVPGDRFEGTETAS